MFKSEGFKWYRSDNVAFSSAPPNLENLLVNPVFVSGCSGVCEDEDFLFNLMVEDESIILGEDHSCAEMQLVLRDMENLVFNQTEREKRGDHLVPLCTLWLGAI